jgi:hypothetical protein
MKPQLSKLAVVDMQQLERVKEHYKYNMRQLQQSSSVIPQRRDKIENKHTKK